MISPSHASHDESASSITIATRANANKIFKRNNQMRDDHGIEPICIWKRKHANPPNSKWEPFTFKTWLKEKLTTIEKKTALEHALWNDHCLNRIIFTTNNTCTPTIWSTIRSEQRSQQRPYCSGCTAFPWDSQYFHASDVSARKLGVTKWRNVVPVMLTCCKTMSCTAHAGFKTQSHRFHHVCHVPTWDWRSNISLVSKLLGNEKTHKTPSYFGTTNFVTTHKHEDNQFCALKKTTTALCASLIINQMQQWSWQQSADVWFQWTWDFLW